ncbi:hypothetical protein ACTSNL_004292 [Salmonella enterica subsp. enterica]
MEFKKSRYEDGTYFQEFTFWENAALRALFEYQKILDLGLIEKPKTEQEFCTIVGKIMGNMRIVGDLPFAEYELENFNSSSISIGLIKLVLNQPLSKVISIPE